MLQIRQTLATSNFPRLRYIYCTINDKSYVIEKLHGFCGFLMNCTSFPYESLEQWQLFQYR